MIGFKDCSSSERTQDRKSWVGGEIRNQKLLLKKGFYGQCLFQGIYKAKQGYF